MLRQLIKSMRIPLPKYVAAYGKCVCLLCVCLLCVWCMPHKSQRLSCVRVCVCVWCLLRLCVDFAAAASAQIIVYILPFLPALPLCFTPLFPLFLTLFLSLYFTFRHSKSEKMQNKKWHLIYSPKPRRDANRPATNHLLANLWQIYANYVSRCPRALFPSANREGPKGRQ